MIAPSPPSTSSAFEIEITEFNKSGSDLMYSGMNILTYLIH